LRNLIVKQKRPDSNVGSFLSGSSVRERDKGGVLN
jgi:hypothetical protein